MEALQRGSVITWDFDILKGDIYFTVYYSHHSLPKTPHEHHVSGAVGGVGSTQYLNKHMISGIDTVEPVLLCHDGDSIQVNSCPHFISIYKHIKQYAVHIL